MWFCIKCGKEVSKEELIRGYCINCFTRNFNLLERVPEIRLTICPKCGSWFHRGEWNSPSPENEILESVAEHELRKCLVKGTELLSVHVISLERANFNTIRFDIALNVFVDGKFLNLSRELVAKISHRQCPRCITRSAGKYNYLIQIRLTGGKRAEELLKEALSAVLVHVDREALVDVKRVPEGIDIELDDVSTVKKILDVLHKEYAAHISTSFKATRYNAHQGRWIGVTTYVARIPVFGKDCIVIYRGEIGLVKSVSRGKLVLWFPRTDSHEEVDIREYWKGILKPAIRVEREVYTVKDIDNDTALLENPSTGDVKRVKLRGWLKSLKLGDTVNLIKVDNFETVAPRSLG